MALGIRDEGGAQRPCSVRPAKGDIGRRIERAGAVREGAYKTVSQAPGYTS